KPSDITSIHVANECEKEKDAELQSADETHPSQSNCCLFRINRALRRNVRQRWALLKQAVLLILLIAYLVYFAYCMYRNFGDEPSIRLLVGTVFGLLIVCHHFLSKAGKLSQPAWVKNVFDNDSERGKRLRKIFRWSLYALALGGAVAYLVVEIAINHPRNLMSLAGLAVLLLVSFFLSTDPEKVNWHAVFWGMALQFWFAVFIRRTAFGAAAFEWLADRVVEFLKYTDKGSALIFGSTYLDHRFVFQLMPTLIFFNAVICMLYYMGVVQVIIAKFGKFLSVCLGTSPIESVNQAANLILSLTESPILIKPFLGQITNSELFAVMTGGFASIAGAVLWTFAAYGAPVDHILTASVMSAPAALAFAKLIFPDDRPTTVKAEDAYKVDVGVKAKVKERITTDFTTFKNWKKIDIPPEPAYGATDGLKMVGFVVVNLLVYVAILEFLDMTLLWFAERAGVEGFTFSSLLGYVFYPMTYIMGYDPVDCLKMSRLLGVKILTTTTVSYIELGRIITNGEEFTDYMATYNSTWRYVGEDIFLDATNTTLVGGVVTKRSGVLATYMLCGLSNLGTIGMTIGCFASLCPARAVDVIKHVPFAFVAGNFASFSTACVA
ncbi:hypothetical protein BaRGS_00012418, partial [Batillaria attramentaria]